ncbi:Peptidoglycan/xylan/chitin deacetylase, PgdA/CDA1 family [Anaerovirgula multivorans]|uniref:Peptidoglycan/xylan/chitin deacetylase, PgdA/CDA1 family n=1 Tax=Anaerovirgula multivorans TaxID=312168 RepID=A0A239BSJ0_9FIRM|nr:polysaccharide deacetylase family protein [Anaerovirgula multivorans]SNS10995.1 Peptidoglycan/xylan/chitin deacetylase, PgdA/CDA1 family [Anaerovirgula multivorans]
MQHLKTSITVILLTIVFTGVLSFEVILPYETVAIVDAEDVVEEAIDDLTEEETPTEEDPIVIDENAKVVYLTFDDGPSPDVTSHILDILKEYNIQATFFVIGNLAEQHPDILLRTWEEGHLVGNHTYTHNFRHIYGNPQNFLDEVERTDEVFSSILGTDYYKSKFIRFPGGSFGKRLQPFRQAVGEAGYISIDWNVVTGDAEGHRVSPQKQLTRLQETLQNKKEAIVLMHDSNTKQTTVEALPEIIDYLISQDYVFKTLKDYEF